MKQNKYDDPEFFSSYKQMARSIGGLEAAGEWHVFRRLLPDLNGTNVLDLGCGFGWHCRYAREAQAESVIGVDLSANMLGIARELTDDPGISYIQLPIEDIEFDEEQFDLVLSSLALHYIRSYGEVCAKVFRYLKPGGRFVFSVEHPIFTSREAQDWHYDNQGNILHWPVDDYQHEGLRTTTFLTDHVVKYHRTLSTYLKELIRAGFAIRAVEEPVPSDDMLAANPVMRDEWRRPMFLIVAAQKI